MVAEINVDFHTNIKIFLRKLKRNFFLKPLPSSKNTDDTLSEQEYVRKIWVSKIHM